MAISTFSKNWTLGLMMLALVVLLWVLSSFLINIIFESGSYRKPFLITYINTAAFMFYLVPTWHNIIRNYNQTGNFYIHEELLFQEEGTTVHTAEEETNGGNPVSGSETGDDNTARNLLVRKNDVEHEENDGNLQRLSLPETIKLSAQFCILWFLANFATNAALAYTSVSSQTILSSTSSFFTLFIGALCNVESINRLKLIGAVISFVGITLVTRSDSNQKYKKTIGILDDTDGEHTFYVFIGNLLALAGALFYGVYSTLLKKKVVDENRINMKIFFGFVGLFTVLLLWPSLLVLDHLGWETFELPRDPQVIFIILLNCVITFISDFCWAKAMLLTSPLTVTVGLSVTIPVAIFGDFIFRHKKMSFVYLIGAVFILSSFFIISRSSEEEHFERAMSEEEALEGGAA
ncbi:uncharacterized protein KNAG_0B03560 [Huiozyma naganishii CBS 8797]|uniref:EamA domain-containing protein n=1 Tax=Huiozyma naganishii (strain ATCC MYA-139 / BCRC 22969 / CBS 8797 / KCTC 17520 / NBRC 10181 / NCYC 3082 / Yp74L-3) TaxID=1071383 RepID=J7RGY5_HUIN7|nr:hypothetical protein KNAG_0B03560 [Kazachstania naganishii CBS 8797]CCK68798.1 hypothetical protein KNAG_0B03560 [Kazachstania naganishii CBS 8797]